MELKTKRLILRSLKKSDAKDLQIHANNVRIAKYLGPQFPHPYTLKDARDFIKLTFKEARTSPREKYNFAITLWGDGKIIGVIGLTNVDHFNKTATIGYWLGQKHWRNGYMTEALQKVIDYSFIILKLRRIDISAMSDNIASNALIKKVGFVYEGRRRKRLRNKVSKTYHDQNEYGMLKEDYIK